jgi:hypothetical protein|tara:strand:+ start:3967 stop:4161 length:195 start_codon:yes stop_codon:yes gene_type:complete
MDISIALEHLGLNTSEYRLSQSVPPHTIIEWRGPGTQPTDAELQAAYDEWVAIPANAASLEPRP